MIDRYIEFRLWVCTDNGDVATTAQTGWPDLSIRLTAGDYQHDVPSALAYEALHLTLEMGMVGHARANAVANILTHTMREMVAGHHLTVCSDARLRFL